MTIGTAVKWKALVLLKSDNSKNPNNNNVGSAWNPLLTSYSLTYWLTWSLWYFGLGDIRRCGRTSASVEFVVQRQRCCQSKRLRVHTGGRVDRIWHDHVRQSTGRPRASALLCRWHFETSRSSVCVHRRASIHPARDTDSIKRRLIRQSFNLICSVACIVHYVQGAFYEHKSLRLLYRTGLCLLLLQTVSRFIWFSPRKAGIMVRFQSVLRRWN